MIKQTLIMIVISIFDHCMSMVEEIKHHVNIGIEQADIKNNFTLKNQNKLNDWLFLKYYFPKLASELQYHIVKIYVLSLMKSQDLKLRKKLKALSLISKEFGLFVESLLKDRDLIELESWQLMLEFEQYIKNNSELAFDLIKASADNNYQYVFYCLLAGANPNQRIYEAQHTPLIVASDKGNEQIVKLLILSEVLLESSDYTGNTPLIYAVYNGHKKIVELLLEAGANINCYNSILNRPLLVAIYSDYTSNNGLIIRNSAEAEELRYQIVELLLKRGAAVNEQNLLGNTALILSAAKGYKKIVKLLLSLTAKVNLRNRNRDTALIAAARGGHKKIVTMLLKHKANVNAENIEYETALKVARDGHYKEIQNLLIKHSAIEIEPSILSKINLYFKKF